MIRVLLLTVLLCVPLAEAKNHRSQSVRAAFMATHPCPANGNTSGTCPGYEVDHVVALVCGGQDSVDNMQWLSVAAHRAKTRRDVRQCYIKDRRP